MHRLIFTRSILLLFFSYMLIGCSEKISKSQVLVEPENEIIYHVFQRSFYDSNGDSNGDLKGLEQKLDYLQDLGVTSILMVPLYESIYYHNYYTNDFYKIDSTLGSEKDYISLVKEIHRRGMKLYMDMETQYVTEDHPWYKGAVGNPESPFSDYILFEDSAHNTPATFVMDLRGWTGYDGRYKKIVTVNLKNKEVLDYNIDLFKHWVDPNNDGVFDDGVDGFRFDHMMDELDNKPQLRNLFETFWTPLIKAIKYVNPALNNMAEQANWGSWGDEYVKAGLADRIFSFKLMGAIRSMDKKYLMLMADSAFTMFPDNNQQIVFIENHDIARFSNQVNRSIPEMKIGAALNLLLGGTPAIYYGQEIGMHGGASFGQWGMHDGNEIPMREAFEWYKSDSGKGMAIWYKNSGIWWDSTNLKPNDGISLEEQIDEPTSLFNFYKKLISIRKSNPVISNGKFVNVINDNNKVFTFLRKDDQQGIMVAINLSDTLQNAGITTDQIYSGVKNATELISGKKESSFIAKDQWDLALPRYEIKVWKIEGLQEMR